jgi:hypothetical protein
MKRRQFITALGRSKQMPKSVATAAAFTLFAATLTAASAASKAEMRDKFFDEFALAGLLAERCGTLQFNDKLVQATTTMLDVNQSDIEPRGKYGKQFTKHYNAYADMVAKYDPEFACRAGFRAFGPEGSTTKNLLIDNK